MKKVYLDNLPKKIYQGRQCIDWINSTGFKVNFEYDGIVGEFKIIGYNKNDKKLSILYHDKVYYILTGNMVKCHIGKIINAKNYDYVYNVGDIIKDKHRNIIIKERTYMLNYYKNNKIPFKVKAYKILCLKCGFSSGEHYKNGILKNEYIVSENALLYGSGCPCCSLPSKITVRGINSIYDTNKNKIKYLKNKDDGFKYSSGSRKKITLVCPICGYEIESNVMNLCRYNYSCIKCGSGISYPEKFMANILNQLNIKYETQYNPKWIKPKRYDFYLYEYNIIIEMDGEFHFKDNPKSKQSLEEIQKIDNYKDKLAKEHDIEVIRIDSNYQSDRYEYIKSNILKSRLVNVINLDNIDWNLCEKFSNENIIKEICDYWNNKEEYETTETISKNNEWGIKDRGTIRKYLKIGTRLGLCKYNSDYELKKTQFGYSQIN